MAAVMEGWSGYLQGWDVDLTSPCVRVRLRLVEDLRAWRYGMVFDYDV